MQENTNNNIYIDESEINVMELISKLWNKRSLIIRWCVVGAIIGWIPVIGIIGSILSIIALVMTLNGWKLIAQSENA